jgi:hypothetical protein
MGTITSANATIILTVPGVLSSGVALGQWAADDMFTSDSVAATEVVMGVDGHQSLGWLPHPVKIKFKFAADSYSIAYFDQWYYAQVQNQDAIAGGMVITMPGNGAKYNCTNGGLVNYKPIPDAKKMLEAQEFEISFESVQKANM